MLRDLSSSYRTYGSIKGRFCTTGSRECTDGYQGWCMAQDECFNGSPWPKNQPELGCRVRIATTHTTAQSQPDGTTEYWTCPAGSGWSTAGVVGCRDNGLYTDNSAICKAAVHQGLITMADGGKVAVMRVGTSSNYCGATYNGVATYPFVGQTWPAITLGPVCPPNFQYPCFNLLSGDATCFNNMEAALKCAGTCDSWCALPHASPTLRSYMGPSCGRWCY
eukprot:g34213.t1